jgi:hypothetical protein
MNDRRQRAGHVGDDVVPLFRDTVFAQQDLGLHINSFGAIVKETIPAKGKGTDPAKGKGHEAKGYKTFSLLPLTFCL